jgi:membrane AbrB-like protein
MHVRYSRMNLICRRSGKIFHCRPVSRDVSNSVAARKASMNLFLSFLAACVGGFVGYKTRFPAGEVLIGMVLAEACDRELARKVAELMWPMLISCSVLILAGLCTSYFFYRAGYVDFPTAYIAGSPGAMQVLVAMSGDMKADVALVAAFHSVRLIIVSVSAPLIFKYFVQS